MTVNDREYFEQRAIEERARARSAASPAAAQVHMLLAAKYDSLVKQKDEPPELHMMSGLRRHA